MSMCNSCGYSGPHSPTPAVVKAAPERVVLRTSNPPIPSAGPSTESAIRADSQDRCGSPCVVIRLV
jgi:hypothetical protein